MDDMNDEQFEQFQEAVIETAEKINERITSAQEAGVEPHMMMFRLMYPLVDVPSGEKCDKPGCACGGKNDEFVAICTAVN